MTPNAWSQPQTIPMDNIANRLNAGLDTAQIVTEYTGMVVAGGFVTSGIKALQDGPRVKIFVTAFHIPNQAEHTVHHFKIEFRKVKRQNQETPWNIVEFNCIDSHEAISNLSNFIKEQSSLVGIHIEEDRVYHAIGIKQTISIEEVQGFVDEAMSGDKVVVEKTILASLKEKRTSDEQIDQYQTDLEEFRRLIAEPNTTETDMQNFLKFRIWFFGLDYIQSHMRSKPKFTTGLGSEYDFLLEGFNQVYDIAELKGPNDHLIERHSAGTRTGAFNPRNDYRYSINFSRALHQVICYMYEFEQSFGHIQTGQPNIRAFMYPKSIIVISKRTLFPDIGKDSAQYLHLLNRQYANIQIFTYDDLADRAENIIAFLKAANQTENPDD